MPTTINSEGCFDSSVRNTINANFTAPVSSSAPAAANSTGTAGQIAYDATHVYICVAANTWVRATLASW